MSVFGRITFSKNGAGCFTIMVAKRSAVDKLGVPVAAELAMVTLRRSSGRANLLVREGEVTGAKSPNDLFPEKNVQHKHTLSEGYG